jgi:hypothetical protein
MKAYLMIFLILAWTLPGCSEKKDSPSITLDHIKAHAEAQVKIERMRKQSRPDWQNITKQYEITARVVKEMDARAKSHYDVGIREAIVKCSRGENVRVNQQVLAKGLQHITVMAITRELDLMREADAVFRKQRVKRISAYFEGIRPTFSRRDKDYYGGKRTLEAAADRALQGLIEAAEEESTNLLAARRKLEDVIDRTYAHCVLFEVSEIETLRDRDLAKCDVKRMEAVIFHRIIHPRIQRQDPNAGESLSALLNGPYTAMSAEAVKAYLTRGLPGISLG